MRSGRPSGRTAHRRRAPVRRQRSFGSRGGCTPRSTCTDRTSPTAPSAISSRIRTMAGWNRVHIASIANTPVCAASAAISRVASGRHRERLLDQHRLPPRAAQPARRRGAGGAGWRCRRRRRPSQDDQCPVGVVRAGDVMAGGEGPRRARPSGRRRPRGDSALDQRQGFTHDLAPRDPSPARRSPAPTTPTGTDRAGLGRRRGLHRHAAPAASGGRAGCAARGEGDDGREGVHGDAAGHPGDRRGCAASRRVRDGGDVDAVPAGHRRGCGS